MQAGFSALNAEEGGAGSNIFELCGWCMEEATANLLHFKKHSSGRLS
jgi:hypothetical protein